MRRRLGAIAMVGGMLALAACGVVPGLSGPPQPRAEAVPVDAMACSDFWSGGAAATAGMVPDDTEIIAVLRCVEGRTIEDAEGMWSAQVIERYEGDVGPFLAAANAQSEPSWPGPCTADMVLAPDLWVETADGRFLNVSYPQTGCGKPMSAAIDAALAELDLVDETVIRLGMTESFEATSVGCATSAAVAVLALGDGLEAVPEGGATTHDLSTVPFELPELADADDVAKLRVCVYGTAAAQEGVPTPVGSSAGVFVSSHELRTPDARAAVVALAAAAPAPVVCATEASRIVVAHPILNGNTLAPPFTVELDGCARAVDPGMQPFVAPPELIALLTP